MSDIRYASGAASLFACCAREPRQMTTCEGCQNPVDAAVVVIVAGWQLCPACAAQVKKGAGHAA